MNLAELLNRKTINKLAGLWFAAALLIWSVACAAPQVLEVDAVETPLAVEEGSRDYLNPALSPQERAEDLLARMTLEEKFGQMTLIEKGSLVRGDVTRYFLGGVLSGGGGYPAGHNNPDGWREMVVGFQAEAMDTRLGIPIIYGVDAVHGHNNVKGAVIFPHNIGLGATANPALVEQIGEITALETSATAIKWNYAPVLAVVQDIRWGRTYESYGEDPDLVSLLGEAYIRGLQGDDLVAPTSVAATAKHFVGDGGTSWGSSTTANYIIDQGNTILDEEALREIHLAPYYPALEAGAKIVMISFSSWNGEKMHGQDYLINTVLKGEMGFRGFVVSDWQGIDQVADNFYEAVVQSINAGVDMNMVPYNANLFIFSLQSAVENGDISEERIDDAVRRILTVKFEMGLFEDPYLADLDTSIVGSELHRAVSQAAVSQSLVLLKNENQALPIDKNATVFVAGLDADDIGVQCGGWTIEWQGQSGYITTGTTILEGLRQIGSDSVYFNRFGKFEQFDQHGDVGIVVIGESPYAEGVGDSGDLTLSDTDIALIERMRSQVDKLVVVLVSGRPLIITEQLPLADAWVAAWLPGSEGQGVADNLYGEHPFTGKLPVSWPRSMDDLPLYQTGAEPLFPFGFGLEID
jgi:beta-glucosidase